MNPQGFGLSEEILRDPAPKLPPLLELQEYAGSRGSVVHLLVVSFPSKRVVTVPGIICMLSSADTGRLSGLTYWCFANKCFSSVAPTRADPSISFWLKFLRAQTCKLLYDQADSRQTAEE